MYEMAKKKSLFGINRSLKLRNIPWFLVVLIAIIFIAFVQNGKDTVAQLFEQQFCYSYENGSCISKGLKVSCSAAGLMTGPQCLDPERTFGAAPSAVTASSYGTVTPPAPVYSCDNATAPVCAGTCPSGTRCAPFGATGSCACYGTVTPPAPVYTCGGTDATMCNGSCPDGSECRYSPIRGACACQGVYQEPVPAAPQQSISECIAACFWR